MERNFITQQMLELAGKYGYPTIITDLQPSIRMKTVPRQENLISLGASKIGGTPDLPAEMSWPERDGMSLPFIAQVHLPDIAHYGINPLLPKTGILYFFFDDKYFSPHGSPVWKVLYFNKAFTQLQRMPIPHPAPAPYEDLVMPSCTVAFSLEMTIPPFDSLYTQHIQLEEDYFDLLAEVEHLYDPNPRPAIHRILGHPDAIQQDMQLACQQRWVQIHNQALSKQALEVEARKWLLLLQISWDENIQRDWSDSGKLYYWMRPEDLDALNFDGVQFIHQCY